MAALERQARQAERAAEFEQVVAAERELLALSTRHEEDFPRAERPLAQPPPPVDEATIRKTVAARAREGIGLFDREAKRRAKGEAEAAAEAEIAQQRQQAMHDQAHHQEQVDRWWQQLVFNDPATVIAALDAAFEDNVMPAAPLDCDGDQVVIAVSLPPVSAVIPERKPSVTPTGRPSIQRRTKSDRNNSYILMLASNVIATLNEAFAVAPGINYVTMLAVEKDDVSRRLEALYAAGFRRSELAGGAWDGDRAYHALSGRPGLIHQNSRTKDLAPLDLAGEWELAGVMLELADQLGYRAPSAEPWRRHVAEKRTNEISDAPSAGSGKGTDMQAQEVPIVRDSTAFVTFERERLAAIEQVRAATDVEAQLAATLLVTNLYQQQLDQFSELLDQAKELPSYDPRLEDFKAWTNQWLDQAHQRFSDWGDYQEKLVATVGRDRAEHIAEQVATPKLQGILDEIKAQLAAQLRELEGQLPGTATRSADQPPPPPPPPPAAPAFASRAPEDDAGKPCPDCAEFVKPAARVCRFCGYRFDEAR
jgi:hypothetical protein